MVSEFTNVGNSLVNSHRSSSSPSQLIGSLHILALALECEAAQVSTMLK